MWGGVIACSLIGDGRKCLLSTVGRRPVTGNMRALHILFLAVEDVGGGVQQCRYMAAADVDLIHGCDFLCRQGLCL